MAKSKVSVYAKCPYYRREERQKILCEGVQDGTSIHLVFGSVPSMKGYTKCFCKGDYNRCLLAKMLNGKYDYET